MSEPDPKPLNPNIPPRPSDDFIRPKESVKIISNESKSSSKAVNVVSKKSRTRFKKKAGKGSNKDRTSVKRREDMEYEEIEEEDTEVRDNIGDEGVNSVVEIEAEVEGNGASKSMVCDAEGSGMEAKGMNNIGVSDSNNGNSVGNANVCGNVDTPLPDMPVPFY